MLTRAFYLVFGMFLIYLYVDKFLFRGKLAHLFIEGWRQLLPFTRRFCRRRPAVPQAPVPESVLDRGATDALLVERKRYVSGQRMPAGAKVPETVSNDSEDDTFVSAPQADGGPEVFEWRAPEFLQRKPPGAGAKGMPHWEDKGFACAHFVPGSDGDEEPELVEIPDMEQIRREVASTLEMIRDAELRAELEPTDEEKYGIDHFDADTFR